MEDVLLRHDEDGLCTLTLNRPDKMNALNVELFERLDEEFARLENQTDGIGCIVLRGNGRCFSAGGDLDAFGKRPDLPATFKPGVIERMSRLPQPVIISVHSTCFTGALELALAGDLIVAGASARFADTHGRWGFVGGWGMSQRLPRRIGPSAAKLMMFTGRTLDAAQALAIGLVDLTFPDADMEREVTALAREILGNSWHSSRETKRLLRESEGLRLTEGLAHERDHHPGNAPDYKERIAAFQARKPKA